MTELHYRLPNEVAGQLQVSPSTLRRWSGEFADFLSGTAGHGPSATGQASHRRYTDADVETLMAIKGLLAEGMTYIQVCKRLEAVRLRRSASAAGETVEPERALLPVLVPQARDGDRVAPAVTILADTLQTVAEGQQLLLGSQQASRDLLSVVVQDNFSLKEENVKLRDRMLRLERDLAELHRLDGIRRETLEARLQHMEEQLRQRGPAVKTTERPGCLASLFGPLT
jgi:DNA-binding transcriptional MerR regulator